MSTSTASSNFQLTSFQSVHTQDFHFTFRARFSHDADVQTSNKREEDAPQGTSPQRPNAGLNPRVLFPIKRAHRRVPRNVRVQGSGFRSLGTHLQNHRTTSFATLAEEGSSTAPADAQRVSETVREHADAIAREETTKIKQLVFGSIVTYSAGLDVSNLITGFETCAVHVRNLPSTMKKDDVYALLKRHGLTADCYHLAVNKKSGGKLEAHVVTDEATERILTSDLNGVEIEEKPLFVEVTDSNSLDGMAIQSHVLVISWRTPYVCYIAEYIDADAAKVKAKELNCTMYDGRCIKAEINAQTPFHAIKIDNFPPHVTGEDVMSFTKSISAKRLPVGSSLFNALVVGLVRASIERAVPAGKLKKFDVPPGSCTMDGVVSARAHFSSWGDAHAAYTSLLDKPYGIWLRLPDPMYNFTLIIPAAQYKAQKSHWDSLSSSIKDGKACVLDVSESGKSVTVRLSGLAKEAMGALKVEVENLARGEEVEGWHRSFGIPGNLFIHRVCSESGAYLRADCERKILKVYGTLTAVDRACKMVKVKLDKLASLYRTVTLAKNSVGFFDREGIQQLKDMLGENNVRFDVSSRKITVSGSEEARHALDCLIVLSRKGRSNLQSAFSGGQTCPVCTEQVSSPHRLDCGHTYCVACLHHLISSALKSKQLPLTCHGGGDQCHVPIPIPTIQQFVPPAAFKRMLEAAFDTYITKHPEEFKNCKTPECRQIYRVAQVSAARTLHCPSCCLAVCNGCHENGHDGLSCAQSRLLREEAEQERLSNAWIAEQGGRVKKCPRCSVPIEKTKGCNHMTCRCGAHICWQCMGVFSADTIYPHMRTVHRTIHGNGPAPPVDIGLAAEVEQQRELVR